MGEACSIGLSKISLIYWIKKNRNTATKESFKKFLIDKRVKNFELLFDEYLNNVQELDDIWLFMESIGYSMRNPKTKKDFIEYMTLKLEEGNQTNPSSEPEFNIEGMWKSYNETKSMDDEAFRIYGISTLIDSMRKREFRLDVVNRIFLRRDNSGKISVITDIYSLQKSIINYKLLLFNTLIDYINNTCGTNYSNKIYQGRNLILNDELFVTIMNKANELFDNGKVSQLLSNDFSNKSYDLINAVSAYLNIKYFDDLLGELLEGLLAPIPALKGKEVGYAFNTSAIIKYSINPDSKGKIVGWNTAEYRDGIKESSNILKILVESVEIEDINGVKLGNNLDIANIIKAWNSFIYQVSNLPESNSLRKKIIDDINTLNQSPLLSIFDIFNKLFHDKRGYSKNPKELGNLLENLKSNTSNRNLIPNYNLTEFDVNVLRTVFKNFIEINENRKNLIYAETNQIESGNIPLSSLLFSELLPSLLIRVNPINYLETIYDLDNNEYHTRVKTRYDSNRDVFNYRQILNSNFFLESLLFVNNIMNTYNPTILSKNRIKIKLGNNNYIISQDNYIFNNNNNQDGVNLLTSETELSIINDIIDEIFDGDSLSASKINDLINYFNSNKTDNLAGETIKFIESMLNLGLTSERGLSILQTVLKIEGNAKSYFKNLLSAAAKVAYAYSIKNKYNQAITNEYVDLKTWLNDQEQKLYGFSSLSNESKKVAFTTIGDLNTLNIIGSRPWVDKWFNATAQYIGTNSKATTKNLQGNNIPNTRPTSLAGQFREKLINLETNGGANLLFSNTIGQGMIMDFVPASDLLSKYLNSPKEISKVNVLELIYDSFVNNFLNIFSSNGAIATQLTVYSDKTQIINAIVNLSKSLGNYSVDNKTLKELSFNLLEDLWFKSVGSYFKLQFNNVKTDLIKILGLNLDATVYEINDVLKLIDYNTLNEKRKAYNMLNPNDKINIVEDLHYRVIGNHLAFNELLLNYNELYLDKKLFRNSINDLCIEMVNDMLDYGINIYEDEGGILSRFLKNTNGIEMLGNLGYTVELFRKEWIKDGILILAKYKNGTPLLSGDTVDNVNQINPLLRQYFYLDNIISGNLKYALLGAETFHPNKASTGLKNIPSYLDQKLFPNRDSYTDLVSLKQAADLEVDVNKKNILLDVWNNLIHQTISASEGTQYKRNVILPAPFLNRLQKSLRANAPKIKIAVIRDTKSKVFNINGDKSTKEDANDGSATVTSFETILMNGSLGDLAVSYDITKPIGYHYDPRTGVMSELKFAAHTLSNAKMRLSNNSKYTLFNLFRRNTNLIWSLDIQNSDITKNKQNCKNSSINFAIDITSGKEFTNGKLYYEELGEVYEIKNLYKIGDVYYTLEENLSHIQFLVAQLFDEDNRPIKIRQTYETKEEFILKVLKLKENNNYSTINSLYKLWEAMGGIDSGHLEEDGFVYDETSHFAVVNFMNNYNIKKDIDNPDNIQSLDYYYQPLKDLFISYDTNISALKCGQVNVNNESCWSGNEDLDYMEFDTDTFGPQQDSDHTADDSEMSEFTLVMSSVDAGGKKHWLAKLIFQDLGKATEIILKEDMDILLDYVVSYSDPNISNSQKQRIKSLLYHIIGKEFIKNGSIRGEGLGKAIIKSVNQYFKIRGNHYKDLHKLPFSDPNIYSQVMSSYLTRVNKGIKRKYPGIGSVISPGFNTALFWEINGIPYLWDDLYREASKKYPPVKGFTENGFISVREAKLNSINQYLLSFQDIEPIYDTRDWIEPTDIIDIIDLDGNVIDTLDLDDIDVYYSFYKGTHTSIYGKKGLKYRKNIIKPRNLRPQRVSFEYTVGNVKRKGNLFQLKPVYEAFLNGTKPGLKLDTALYDLVHKNTVLIYTEEGKLVTGKVNPDTIINEAAETIASNIYKTKLGQGNRSLNDILLNGILIKNPELLSIEGVEMYFISNTGNHTLITFTKPTQDKYTEKSNFDDIEVDIDKYGNMHRYATINNQKMEIGRGIIQEDMRVDSESRIINKEGNIVNDSSYITHDNKVYKINDFIEVYDKRVYTSKGFNKYKMYYINKLALKNVFSTLGKFTQKGMDIFIANTLGKLFSSGRYGFIQLNTNLTDVNTVKSVLNYLQSSYYLNNAQREIVNATYYFLSDPKFNKEKSVWKNGYGGTLLKAFEKLRKQKQIQFEASRYFTVARIPAQSLQSYMQMKLVGYINTNSNVAIVSHWQTWLQGSDYDIDKAYMMGFSFDDNGNFLQWSPLFNTNSKQTFLASMLLPVPKGKKLVQITREEVGKLMLEGTEEEINSFIDLTSDFNTLNSLLDEATKIRYLARIIAKIDSVNSDTVRILGGEAYLIALIQSHENSTISDSYMEDTLKNSISGKLLNIVQDIENIPLAYSYITMKDLRYLANNTPNGVKSSFKIGMNPVTKYIMLYQNMIGKQVIGIAAVGEKIFMGLSYYYNESVRITDPKLLDKKLKYLRFEQKFDRIQGRWNPDYQGLQQFYGKPESVSKRTVTDVNFTALKNPQYVKERLYEVNAIREEYKSTGLNGKALEAAVEKYIRRSGNSHVQADLIISLLLSAATDNAKELILERINSGPDTAGIYLNLIMLGFSINDICAFMSSPAIDVLIKRTRTNMFDKYNNEFDALKHMNVKIEEAMGKLDPRLFKVDNDITQLFKEYALLHPDSFNLFSTKTLSDRSKVKSHEDPDYLKLRDYIQAIVLELVRGKITIDDLLNAKIKKENNSEIQLNLGEKSYLLIQGINQLAKLIKSAVRSYNQFYEYDSNSIDGLKDYFADLNEYKHISSILKETTFLGTALMGINKGLSAKQSDMIAKVRRIEKFWEDLQGKYSKIEDILEAKPFYTKEEVEDIIKRAKEAGLTDYYGNKEFTFSFTKYLINENNYREIAAEYYNLIKDSWNVFDVVNSSPLYHAALEAFKVGWINPTICITKNKIVNVIQQELKNDSSYITQKLSLQLEQYAEKLLILNWLLNLELTFPVSKGQQVINSRFLFENASENMDLDLKSISNRMTFKKWIEDDLLPNLIINGSYSWVDSRGLKQQISVNKNNPFIKYLIKGIDNNKPSYKINMRLNEVDLSDVASREFLQILNGLNSLGNVMIGNYSLLDYLGIYSICTSLNRYGNDKLTGLFRELVQVNNKSLMANYLDSIGLLDIDLNDFTDEQLRKFLRNIGFDANDALIEIAPVYNENNSNNLGKYVRIKGKRLYRKKNSKGEYTIEVSIFPKELSTESNSNQEQALRNLNLYEMLYCPFKDMKNNLIGLLNSDNELDLLDGLLQSTQLGFLEILIKC